MSEGRRDKSSHRRSINSNLSEIERVSMGNVDAVFMISILLGKATTSKLGLSRERQR